MPEELEMPDRQANSVPRPFHALCEMGGRAQISTQPKQGVAGSLRRDQEPIETQCTIAFKDTGAGIGGWPASRDCRLRRRRKALLDPRQTQAERDRAQHHEQGQRAPQAMVAERAFEQHREPEVDEE